MAEKDVVVQWFASLLSNPMDSGVASAAADAPQSSPTDQLPTECVRSSGQQPEENGVASLVARVSQNQRWNLFSGWGSSYPGHLLPTDCGAWSSEDLRVECPGSGDHLLVDPPPESSWAPPPGFAWAAESAWTLDKGPTGTWIGDRDHDDDQWQYAVDMWMLVSHGTGANNGAFVRRRLWERSLVIERPRDVSQFSVDLTRGAGLGLSHELLVTKVVPGGQAHLQGLTVRCKVVAVSDVAVSSLPAFKAALQQCRDRGDKLSTIDFEHPQIEQGKGACGANDESWAAPAPAAAATPLEGGMLSVGTLDGSAPRPEEVADLLRTRQQLDEMREYQAHDGAATNGLREQPNGDADERVDSELRPEDFMVGRGQLSHSDSPNPTKAKPKKKKSLRAAVYAVSFGSKRK